MVDREQDGVQLGDIGVLETDTEMDETISDEELVEVVGGLTPNWSTCTNSSCPQL